MGWSEMVTKDIGKSLFHLKESIANVQNLMKGKTLLVIPEHIEKFFKENKHIQK